MLKQAVNNNSQAHSGPTANIGQLPRPPENSTPAYIADSG